MKKQEMKKPYSNLQRFFWIIAGSEISALEKCPNEYNRHANIGLMILITSLFATMTAAVAGATFVNDNNWGVFVFAITWGIVIFSLDRSMVNSIKKTPGEEGKFNWGFFWPRFVLAFILSFFMSIPLDHIVFKERIMYQMDKNKTADWESRQKSLIQGYGIPGDSSVFNKAEKLSDALSVQIEAGCSACPEQDYKSNMSFGNNIKNNIIPPLEKSVNEAAAKYRNYLYALRRAQTQEGDQLISEKDVVSDDILVSYRNTMNQAIRDRNQQRIEMNRYFVNANKICQAWLAQKKAEKEAVDSTMKNAGKRIDSSTVRINNEAGEYKDMLNKMNGFDTQFVTLFLMPNWGVQILKWLIFLALLVIEILPTYLKLRTPFGQYDWKMYEGDITTEIEIKEKIIQAEIAAKEIEEYRRKKEVELNKELIDKVVLKEEYLANQMISNWELKAKAKMDADINNA
jgi:hypothetical protein